MIILIAWLYMTARNPLEVTWCKQTVSLMTIKHFKIHIDHCSCIHAFVIDILSSIIFLYRKTENLVINSMIFGYNWEKKRTYCTFRLFVILGWYMYCMELKIMCFQSSLCTEIRYVYSIIIVQNISNYLFNVLLFSSSVCKASVHELI